MEQMLECAERKEKNIKGKEKNIQMAIIRRSVSVTNLRLYNKAREYIRCVCMCVYVCADVCKVVRMNKGEAREK